MESGGFLGTCGRQSSYFLKGSSISHKHWLQALCRIGQHGKVTFVGNYEISTVINNSRCYYEGGKVICCRKNQNKIKLTSTIVHTYEPYYIMNPIYIMHPIMQMGEIQIKMDVGKRLEFSFQKDF